MASNYTSMRSGPPPPPPPPPGLNYISAMTPAIYNIFISHTFLILFFPLSAALCYYSTPYSRRRPVFVLNVLNVLLGVAVAIMCDWRAVRTLLVPIDTDTLTFDIAIGVLGCFQSIFVDIILLIRIMAVYPRVLVGMRRFVIIIALPILLKFLRTINVLIFISVLSRLTKRPNAVVLVGHEFTSSPYLKIEWFAQIVDVTYASLFFLFKIWLHRKERQETVGPRKIKWSFGYRLRGLFWIASTNFVVPAFVSLALLIVVFLNVDFEVINTIALVNTDAAVIGVVLASIWAGSLSHREDTTAYCSGSKTLEFTEGSLQFAVRTELGMSTFESGGGARQGEQDDRGKRGGPTGRTLAVLEADGKQISDDGMPTITREA